MEHARIEMPEDVRPGHGMRLAARFAFPALFLVTLLAELALAERKYAIFGGGFGQSQPIDTPLEIGAFLAGLLACHFLLLYGLFHLARWLHRGQADRPLFWFNFAFLGGVLLLGVLVAKYQALSYFSDAISFRIIGNLGGGSLADAFLYVLSEAALLLIGIAGALLLYAGALYRLGLHRRRSVVRDGPRLGRKQLLAALALFPLLLFGVNQVNDARAALGRFNAYALANGLLHQASDFDRDGYSFFSYPPDTHPFDTERHPYTVDPGITSLPEPLEPPVFPIEKKHVVLIVLESTRGDMLGKRVDGRPVAPRLEAMARTGSWAPDAYSHVGFTSFSLKSLFTGKLAPPDDRQSLLRDFRDNGYRIGVLSAQAEDFGDISETTGLRHFADIFVDAGTLKDERAFGFATPASLVVEGKSLLRAFDRYLATPEDWARPTFLYVNLQSAHFPYHMPGMDPIIAGEPIPRARISRANRHWLERTYWNAVANNDRLVGALLDRIEALGVADDTLVVVTSDHGESLFDDGFLGHGHMLNREQMHIPLIINRPGIDLSGAIGLADMRQILLSAAGAHIAPRRRGPVFQYLGDLERPGRIGMVEDGRWITFDLRTRELWTSESGERHRLSSLPEDSPLKTRGRALIAEWGRQRLLAAKR